MIPRTERLKAKNREIHQRRSRRMDAAVQGDLARMGIDDAAIDYGSTKRFMRLNDARTEVEGWTWVVTLKDGDALRWTMQNADDAPVLRGGEVIDGEA